MQTHSQLTLYLAIPMALAACATDGERNKTAAAPKSEEVATVAACKEVARVRITAVNPASAPPNITLDAGRACIATGSALVIWSFQDVSGYVFGSDSITLKPDQPKGLLASFVSSNKGKVFAVFDNVDPATWRYNINFKSSDGKQSWSCDPTITNQHFFAMAASDNVAMCIVTAS